MNGEREKFEQFKRDCRSLKYLTKELIEINEKLEDLAYKMQGVFGISTSDLRYENAMYKDNRLELMEKEEELLNLKKEYASRINRVNRILSQIDPSMMMVITDLYINKKPSEIVAAQYGMTKPTMYARMKEALNGFI